MKLSLLKEKKSFLLDVKRAGIAYIKIKSAKIWPLSGRDKPKMFESTSRNPIFICKYSYGWKLSSWKKKKIFFARRKRAGSVYKQS